ncbi:cytochrome P450 [Kribbella sindirgiensis]|uniref:Cytochrome P450 n=1 Tax=Kribbella sindirgiensis TaxID=1124744 RepID=A0A4V2M2S0_9ACTN|nr:cytochrome P450 [Kribbella sindirgiensis]TCC29232.1 cytochrome P450 [Kribbella sindirgiensis]
MVTVEELTADPHPALAQIRPVGWVEALNSWVVSSRALAITVLRDPETFTVDDPRFSTAQVVGPSMLSLDGNPHKAHRDPFESPFGLAETRRRFTGPVQQTVDGLMAALEQPADLRTGLAGPLSVAVVALSLGLPPASASTVLEWYTAISESVSGVSAGRPVTVEGAAAFAELHKHVAAGIDSSDSLVAAAAHAGLGVDEVVANAAVLMFGGIETTEGMITNALWHLLTHRDQLDLVLADPSLLPNAMEESLRLEPAAAVVDRYATRDLELAGRPIRRGDMVTVSLAGAGRDPEVFESPDDFDVRRANARRHLAFASGPHICLGMHLTRLETLVALEAVLKLPGLRLAADSPPPRGLVFRKPSALRVSWDA